MRYCPRCKIDVFGGSVCGECGGRIVEKLTKQAPKVVHVTQDMIMGAPKRLKSELAQSMTGRVVRLVLEVLIFCALFYGVSWVMHHIINFLSVHMADDPDKAKPPIEWVTDAGRLSSGVRYYLYIGWAIVAGLTIKFRWQAGK
jgi:hypothetical protein